MVSGLSDTDRVGESESIERRTNTFVGFDLFMICWQYPLLPAKDDVNLCCKCLSTDKLTAVGYK